MNNRSISSSAISDIALLYLKRNIGDSSNIEEYGEMFMRAATALERMRFTHDGEFSHSISSPAPAAKQ